MTHAERVPVKFHGVDIGTARVDDDGTIEITTDSPNEPVKLLLEYIRCGLVEGMSIAFILVPAVDAAHSDNERPPLSDFGGFKHNQPPSNDGRNYH
jgi:acylphosphatase